MALKTDSGVVLFSSDAALEEGFDRVKRQGAYLGLRRCAGGPYYEAHCRTARRSACAT
jgi:hypothetical protein